MIPAVGRTFFIVGKFCFFSIFVLSDQTDAGMPGASRTKWSGCGRLSVFFQLDSCEGNDRGHLRSLHSQPCKAGPLQGPVEEGNRPLPVQRMLSCSPSNPARIAAILSNQYILFFQILSLNG